MAQFYGSMKGNRGQTTRMGSKASGMTAHIRGWDIGVRVDLSHRDGVDYVQVYRTSGSRRQTHDVLICEFSEATISNPPGSNSLSPAMCKTSPTTSCKDRSRCECDNCKAFKDA